MNQSCGVDEDLKFFVRLCARREAPPSRPRLVEAIEATDLFQVTEGEGRRTWNEMFDAPELCDEEDGYEPESAEEDLGFRVDPTEGLPIVIAYKPDTWAHFVQPENSAFKFSPWDNGDYSFGELCCCVVTDDEVAAAEALAAVAAFAVPLGLSHSSRTIGDYEPSTADALLEEWRRWRSDLEDERSIAPTDGFIREDRVSGISQARFGIGGESTELVSIDINAAGQPVALLERSGSQHLVWHGGRTADVPEGDWHSVRWRPDGGAVLLGHPARDPEDDECQYGWDDDGIVAFLNPDGSVQARAEAPPGSVAVTDRHVVVTFSDEQVYSGSALLANGLIAMDFDGHITLRYQTDMKEPVDVIDCYAEVHAGGDIVAFYPYTDFQLLLLDLSSNSQRVYPTPEPYGFGALSLIESTAYFHAPYESNGIFRWEIGSDSMEQVGKFPNRRGLRGLPGGKFIAAGSGGYTIVKPLPG